MPLCHMGSPDHGNAERSRARTGQRLEVRYVCLERRQQMLTRAAIRLLCLLLPSLETGMAIRGPKGSR